MRGTITGDLTLEPSSVVELRGTVQGNVTNMGGRLEIYGVVRGQVSARFGQITVDPQAVVTALHKLWQGWAPIPSFGVQRCNSSAFAILDMYPQGL